MDKQGDRSIAASVTTKRSERQSWSLVTVARACSRTHANEQNTHRREAIGTGVGARVWECGVRRWRIRQS